MNPYSIMRRQGQGAADLNQVGPATPAAERAYLDFVEGHPEYQFRSAKPPPEVQQLWQQQRMQKTGKAMYQAPDLPYEGFPPPAINPLLDPAPRMFPDYPADDLRLSPGHDLKNQPRKSASEMNIAQLNGPYPTFQNQLPG